MSKVQLRVFMGQTVSYGLSRSGLHEKHRSISVQSFTQAVNIWPMLAHLINLAGPGFLSLN